MDGQGLTSLQWEEIYEQYHGKVLGYISARVQRRAEAEDLCSEVFEKAWRKMDAYDPKKASVSTWIFTITRNTVIDHYRRTRPSEELDENLPAEGTLEEPILQEEMLGELAGALKEMPEELQDIIVMLYYDQKPMTEIAGIMRLSYGAVKLRHQNALVLLREALEG